MKTAERIAVAAREILEKDGADAVSMRKVAEAVGVTPMAIYRHYENREALLRAIADACSVELARDWEKRAAEGDAESTIMAMLEDFLDFALRRPRLYTFLMIDRRDGVPRFPDDFRGAGAPPFSQTVRAVEAGMRDGTLREDDPLEVTQSFAAQTQGLVQLYLGGRIGLSEEDFRALCRRALQRVFAGLRA
ncbi:TetR/AcrR family transcriptional regulator [Amycolatopsis sp. CA-230715]|uniref:TetR/AcrR family transcriptional regulator n=1 Tax=Amycolatopsis sp. CA-230715 TaxID=2745196 RepID=UPI0020B2F175|nr:TetR/AcrR family transcriptional regulator [Amycolatopsis sp. CA-230715]